MHARLMLIAAATLLASGAIAAEPEHGGAKAPVEAPSNAPKVVLASAEVSQQAGTATEQQAPQATPKRRFARATACRCGDQQGQPEK